MRTLSRAFTLIELLVVIAIIAILAAILFPVFAQAKQAAKGAASISNTKQILLASQMYSGDADDTAIVDGTWNGGNGMVSYGAGGELAPWTWLALPYIKSAAIFNDPLSSPHPTFLNSQTITYCYFSEYGYNYSYLSPWDGTTRHPVSLTSIAKASQTVMFTAKFNFVNEGGFGWYGFGSYIPVLYNVEPPSCDDAPGYCYFNWGDSGDARNGMRGMREEGAFTGGTALRKSGLAVVGWTDGHASMMNPGALAAGTNWTPTIKASDLQLNDKSKYLWSPTYQ